MSEYIEREAVNEKLAAMRHAMVRIYGDGIGNLSANAVDAMKANVNSIPAADVEPVVRGEWELYGNDDSLGCSWFCSKCGWNIDEETDARKWKRCPYCGAHMERSGSGE